MTRYVSWIKGELERRVPGADLVHGYDLNRNGRLEPHERLRDANRNGVTGDHADWVDFYRRNAAALRKLGGMFRGGTAFAPDNPIHDVMHIQGAIANNAAVSKAYAILAEIFREAKRRIAAHAFTPQEKLTLVYNILRARGITLADNPKDHLFISNLLQKHLDCDTSSFVVMAIGHELGWPLHFVSTLNHAFVRWDDGKGIRFNMDYGFSLPDADYIRRQNISRDARARGIYLRSGGRNDFLAGVFFARGNAYSDMKDFHLAARDFTAAIGLNPLNLPARANRFRNYFEMGETKRALDDCARVAALDSTFPMALPPLIMAKIQRRDFRAARALLDKLIALKPEAVYFKLRADVSIELGLSEFARRDFTMAIARKPDSIDAYVGRAGAYLSLKRYNDALSDINEALRRAPKDATLYLTRSRIKTEMGKNGEALADIDKVIELEPMEAGHYFARGYLHARMKRVKEAFDDFSRSSVLTDSLDIKVRAAFGKLMIGQLREAFKDFDFMINVGIRGSLLLYGRGLAYANLKRFDDAIDDFTAALKHNPNDGNIYIQRALAYAARGDTRAAKADIAIALQKEIQDPDNRIALATYFARRGRFAEALAQCDTAIKADPRNASYFFSRGRIRIDKGLYREAIDDMTTALRAWPDDDEPRYLRALAYHRGGMHHEAIADLNGLIARNARHAEGHYLRGAAKNALKLYRDALGDFNKAIALNPKDARFYDERGKAKSMTGDLRGGRRDFDKALALAPKDASYRYHRGIVRAKLGNVAAARRDLQAGGADNATRAKAARMRTRLRAIPQLAIGLEPRYRPQNGGAFEFRTGVGALWNLVSFARHLNLGAGIALGYGAGAHHHALDFAGTVALIGEFGRSRVLIDAGAGYRAHLEGDRARAPVRAGGVFNYGMRYRAHVGRGVELGARLALEHEMKHPSRFAITPGAEVAVNFW